MFAGHNNFMRYLCPALDLCQRLFILYLSPFFMSLASLEEVVPVITFHLRSLEALAFSLRDFNHFSTRIFPTAFTSCDVTDAGYELSRNRYPVIIAGLCGHSYLTHKTQTMEGISFAEFLRYYRSPNKDTPLVLVHYGNLSVSQKRDVELVQTNMQEFSYPKVLPQGSTAIFDLSSSHDWVLLHQTLCYTLRYAT